MKKDVETRGGGNDAESGVQKNQKLTRGKRSDTKENAGWDVPGKSYWEKNRRQVRVGQKQSGLRSESYVGKNDRRAKKTRKKDQLKCT